MLSILWRIMGIEEGVFCRGRKMLTQEPIAYLNRGKRKHAYLHGSIDVKFIFDGVRLGLSSSANILRIADVTLRVVFSLFLPCF